MYSPTEDQIAFMRQRSLLGSEKPELVTNVFSDRAATVNTAKESINDISRMYKEQQ